MDIACGDSASGSGKRKNEAAPKAGATGIQMMGRMPGPEAHMARLPANLDSDNVGLSAGNVKNGREGRFAGADR